MAQQRILYAYAIVAADSQLALDEAATVPEGDEPYPVSSEDWTMIVSSVPEQRYSQDSIDAHASDLEWIGPIGVGHQRVNELLADQGDVIPLRAFTLFSDEAAVRRWLENERESISRVHERLKGKLEWTVRFEFDGDAWIESSFDDERRTEIEEAPAGKAYLLRKKLERELDRSRDGMENDLMRDLSVEIKRRTEAETIVETRISRGGADPQIDLLFDRDRHDELLSVLDQLTADLKKRQIRTTITGPWPPYSFTGSLT